MTTPTILPLVLPISLPYDATGIALANRITSEVHPIDEYSFLNYNLIVPNAGPIFLDGLTVTYTDGSGTTEIMVEGVDYVVALFYEAATRATTKPVYGGLLVINPFLIGTITLTYQSLGGSWIASRSQVVNSLLNNGYDPRVVLFDSVTGVLTAFPALAVTPMQPTDTIGLTALLAEMATVAATITKEPTLPVTISSSIITGITTPQETGQAVFIGGRTAVNTINATEKYSYITGVFVSGAVLDTAVSFGGASSTAQYAWAFGGWSVWWTTLNNTTRIYTYASNTITISGNLVYAEGWGAVAGNATLAIIGSGDGNINWLSANTSIWTYSSNTNVAGGALANATGECACAGNAVTALFAGGDNGSGVGALATTSTYLYSSNTSANGSALLAAMSGLAGVGITTEAVFFGGYSTTIVVNSNRILNTASRYTYANGAMAVGSALSYNTACAGGASSAITAIIKGGVTQIGLAVNTSSVYTYANNSSVTSTVLSSLYAKGESGASPCLGVNH